MELARKVNKRAAVGAVLLTALITALIAGLSAVPAYASTIDKVLFEGASNGTLSKTATGYDVTGDAKPDAVKMWLTPTGDSYSSKALSVSVNGKIAMKLSGVKAAGGGFAKVELLTMSNGTPFVYVQYTGDNSDGYYSICRYKKGKLVTLASADDIPSKYRAHRYLASPGGVKVIGNRLRVTYEPMTLTAGTVDIVYELKYSKGQLTPTSSTAKSVRLINGAANKILTAAQSIKVFSSSSTSKKTFQLKTGDKLRLAGAHLKGGKLSFKVKTPSGRTGWIKAATIKTHRAGSGTLFKETFLAG